MERKVTGGCLLGFQLFFVLGFQFSLSCADWKGERGREIKLRNYCLQVTCISILFPFTEHLGEGKLHKKVGLFL